MDRKEINAKVQTLFNTLSLSRGQKETIKELIDFIIDSKNTDKDTAKVKNDTNAFIQADCIDTIEADANIDTVIDTVNTLINNLKTAGVVKNK